MFVIIIRRTLAGADGNEAVVVASETAAAQAAGCAAVRILRGLAGRPDLFALSDWLTNDAAQGYLAQRLANDPSLVASDDGVELHVNQDNAGQFHLVLLREETAVST